MATKDSDVAATMKHLLATAEHRIELRDFLVNICDAIADNRTRLAFDMSLRQVTSEEFARRIEAYRTLADDGVQAMALAGFWAGPMHEGRWSEVIERLSNNDNPQWDGWHALAKYPELLLVYAAGLAAVASRNYAVIREILVEARIETNRGVRPAVLELNPISILHPDTVRRLPGLERHHTPGSDLLHQTLRDPLRDFLPSQTTYDRVFDQWEYLLALVVADQRAFLGEREWAPIGRFGWRRVDFEHIDQMMLQEAEQHKADWRPLRTGLFGGSLERYQTAREHLLNLLQQTHFY